MTARVGGIIAPYIVFLVSTDVLFNLVYILSSCTIPFFKNDFTQNLAFVVLGAMAFSAGFLALFLPETLFSPMPQTGDQVESWTEDFGLPCRTRNKPPEEVAMKEGKDNQRFDTEEITAL